VNEVYSSRLHDHSPLTHWHIQWLPVLSGPFLVSASCRSTVAFYHYTLHLKWSTDKEKHFHFLTVSEVPVQDQLALLFGACTQSKTAQLLDRKGDRERGRAKVSLPPSTTYPPVTPTISHSYRSHSFSIALNTTLGEKDFGLPLRSKQ
jgi:hypothetical protein